MEEKYGKQNQAYKDFVIMKIVRMRIQLSSMKIRNQK